LVLWGGWPVKRKVIRGTNQEIYLLFLTLGLQEAAKRQSLGGPSPCIHKHEVEHSGRPEHLRLGQGVRSCDLDPIPSQGRSQRILAALVGDEHPFTRKPQIDARRFVAHDASSTVLMARHKSKRLRFCGGTGDAANWCQFSRGRQPSAMPRNDGCSPRWPAYWGL